MAGATVVDGVDVVGSLSPSRAGDFMTCPLLYRFRTIDKLPEASSPTAVRGTVVHKVLEDLFDLPAADRTPERAAEMLEPAWEAVLEAEPEVAELFGDGGPGDRRLAGLVPREPGALLHPRGPAPPRARRARDVRRDAARQPSCCCAASSTGSTSPRPARSEWWTTRPAAPGAMFEAKALFQMKFYALVLWRIRGEVPTMLQLIYLGNGEVLRYCPDEADLLAVERKVDALWKAISARGRDRRLAAAQERAVRLVLPPGALPRVRGGTPPAAAGAPEIGRRPPDAGASRDERRARPARP